MNNLVAPWQPDASSSLRTGGRFALLALLALGGACTVTSSQGGSGGDTSSSSGGSNGSSSGGSTGSGGSSGSSSGGTSGGYVRNPGVGSYSGGPCDIYAKDGGPCVAAHSTVRALYSDYSGHLYQVKKADGTTKDIDPMMAGGLAKSSDQDDFCGSDACTISIIYDQSGKGNDLTKAPAGMAKTTPDNEANAKAISIMLGGNKVYGVHIVPGVGYRNNNATGTATGDNPESEYMVVAGNTYNGGCCMDYGNMETTSRDDGEGTMEAVYFGTCTIWGTGAGDGPWVMGDLENGLWAGDSSPYQDNKPITSWPFVTGMVKGDAAGKNHWTIKEGDATSGMLIMPFNGNRPSSRYNPMRKQGAIGLGTGGDNSNGAKGDWFEGVMTATYASDGADDAVQDSIVSVYGQQSQ